MPEIKSTMDLVMERVGKMEIDQEEREGFRRKEAEDLTQRLFNRYFVQADKKELSALKKELQGAKGEVKAALTEILIANYSPEDPSATSLAGLEIVQEGKGKEIVKALRELTSSYQKERDDELQGMEKGFREELSRKGISGSAVEPNPDSNPRWTDFIGRLNKKYGEQKKEMLNKLV